MNTLPPPIEVALFDWQSGRLIARIPCVTLAIADVVACGQSKIAGNIAMVYRGDELTVWYRDGEEKFTAFPSAALAARRPVQREMFAEVEA